VDLTIKPRHQNNAAPSRYPLPWLTVYARACATFSVGSIDHAGGLTTPLLMFN
jgi:hypothetical protein